MLSESLFESWLDVTPQLLSILLTFMVISTLCIVYNVKIRNHSDQKKLGGFLVLTEMFIKSIENLVIGIMGKKYRKLTPYAMYIILYIFVSAVLSLIGVEPLTTSFTVTFSMGLITFFGIYYFGLKYQKFSFFKKFINPMELLTQFVPLISISFRLFGNILGGSIILGLLYAFLIGLQVKLFGHTEGSFPSELIWPDANGDIENSFEYQRRYWWGGFNIFTTILVPWMHLYFDLFDGGVQAIVFTMLTFSYWAEGMGEHEGSEKIKKISRKTKQTSNKTNKVLINNTRGE